MSLPIIILVTVCYAGVALSELTKGHGPMALVFFGYTVGNFGFIWSMMK